MSSKNKLRIIFLFYIIFLKGKEQRVKAHDIISFGLRLKNSNKLKHKTQEYDTEL